MRRSQRLIAAAVLISLSGVLAGCADSMGKLADWDPSDMLDFLDTKKKIQGERKPVFPEGVPGLEQGVPRQMYKGSAQEQIDQQNAQAAAAAAPDAAPKSRHAKRDKPPAAAPAPDAASAEDGGANAAPPAPKPKKIVRKRTTAPPPDQTAQPAQSGQPAQPQQSAAPFQPPMQSNTFTR
jgi:hypothetical protein